VGLNKITFVQVNFIRVEIFRQFGFVLADQGMSFKQRIQMRDFDQ